MSAKDKAAALRTAVQHIEHMAAWIGKQNAGYSFESLGEDMPGIRAALTAADRGAPASCNYDVIALQAAREIEHIFERAHLGGPVQRKSRVQSAVLKALERVSQRAALHPGHAP